MESGSRWESGLGHLYTTENLTFLWPVLDPRTGLALFRATPASCILVVLRSPLSTVQPFWTLVYPYLIGTLTCQIQLYFFKTLMKFWRFCPYKPHPFCSPVGHHSTASWVCLMPQSYQTPNKHHFISLRSFLKFWLTLCILHFIFFLFW